MCSKVTKFKTFSKTVIMLLVFTMSIFLFMGCQSKNGTSTQNSAQSSNGRGNFNKDAMKQRYQNSLQALVKDGTITQDQSNKILDSLTTNMNNFGGRRGSQNNQGNQQNNNGNNQTSRPRSNPLSKLVSDGVITQQQADKIMENLRGNRQNPNNQNNVSNQ